MKAIVLAGGRGTRLRPLTHTRNKHLIPIGGKTMIERVIDDVVDLGIKEIIININLGDTEIKAALGDGSKWDVKITYIEQEKPNGMMFPIVMAEEILAGDDFVLHAGDNILSGGLKTYYEEFKKLNSSAHLLVTKVSNPERFGVAVVESGFMVKTVEKPKEFISNLAVTGVYFYKNDIIEAMKHVEPVVLGNSSVAEYYPPLAHQWLIDNGYKITVTEVTGWWKDTGKPEDLISANHLVLEVLKDNIEGEIVDSKVEGKVEIKSGAKIINSTLRGPLVIGENTTITNSYVGPFTAISKDCELVNSEIENSIVQNNVKILDFPRRIDNSIIGDNVIITKHQNKPKTTRLLIGDNSEVVI
ncbi:MAG: glucose-1-phosphate thymidylyltransferase [bacterium]